MKTKIILCLTLVFSGNLAISHAEETNTTSTKPELVMRLEVNGKTNNNTVTLDATNSTKEFANSLTTNVEKFILSSTNIVPTNFGAALPKTAAYMKTNVLPTLTNSAIAEIGVAQDFLAKLKKQGHLPGVLKDNHGDLTTDTLSLSNFQTLKYPFKITFHLLLTGDSFTNHYTVLRPAEDAAWKLERAWRTDAKSHVITEWPVK